MQKKLLQVAKIIVFFGIGFLILYLLYRSQQSAYLEECHLKNVEGDCSLIDKIINDFKTVKWRWIFAVLGIFMISNVARATRWGQILAADGYPNVRMVNTLGTIMIGYFVNLGLPRAGELARVGLLSRYEHIPVEKVLASVVLDRIADVICLIIILGLTVLLGRHVFLDYLLQNIEVSTLYKLAAVAVIGLIGLVGVIIYLNKQKNKGNKSWILAKANGFIDGLLSIRKVKNLPLFIFNTVVIWVCYYLMTYVCFFSFEPTELLSPLAGLVTFTMGTLGMVFPSPGGMGSYHYLVTEALKLFSIDNGNAFSFANIIFFAIQLFGNILFGAFFFIILPFINDNKNSA